MSLRIDRKPFRFWCQHVLPLVYDDSLSYYELLCKVVKYINNMLEDMNELTTEFNTLKSLYEELKKYVNDYFDNLDVQEEINNKLDSLVEDGTLSSLIETLVDKTPLREFVSTKPYAQVVPADVTSVDNYWGQGFAIGVINDRPVAFHGCSSYTSDGASCVLTEYFDTGDNIAHNEGNFGHANGATFCTANNHFYLACAGGSDGLNKVVEFDYTCDIINEYSFGNLSISGPFGIAWIENEECFAVVCANNIMAKVNIDFTEVLSTSNIIEQTDATNLVSQSLFTDGDYLYFITNSLSIASSSNQLPPNNKIDVYRISDMSYYCSQFIMVNAEFESADFYNDELYVTTVNNRCIIIHQGDNKRTWRTYDYLENSMYSHNIQQNTTYYCNVYLDKTATNFFINPYDENYPVRNYWAFLKCLHDIQGMGYRIYCRGDFSDCDINWKYRNVNVIRYTGLADSNGEYPKFKNVTVYGAKNVILENIQLIGVSASYHLTVYYTPYCYLRNVTFLENTSATRFITLVSSNANIGSCSFNGQTTECLIRAVEGSSVLWDDSNEFNDVNPSIQGDGLVNIPYKYDLTGLDSDLTQPSVTAFAAGENVDITAIKRSGLYRFENGTTLTNVPAFYEGEASNYYLVVINNGGASYSIDCITYIFGRISGVNEIYIGRKYTSTIVWHLIGYRSFTFSNISGGSNSNIYFQMYGGREVRISANMDVTSTIESGTTICDITEYQYLIPSTNQYGIWTSNGATGIVRLTTAGLFVNYDGDIPTGTCVITMIYAMPTL